MKKVILTLALIGMGSFAIAQQTTPQDKQAKREEMQQKMQQKEQQHLDKMQQHLNLNQTQLDQIKDLHAKRKAEMKADFDKNKGNRQAKMDQMKANREQMDADMKKILTPEQQAKWTAERNAKMEKRKAGMKERGMKGGKMMKKTMITAPPATN